MDRGGWKLGKLERLGQPEDLKLEDCEYGSLDHLEAGDRERQPAEGGREAGSSRPAVSLPETLLAGNASQD